MNIILLGAPGAGKGTQATRIEEHYNVRHISTGDIFRHHMRQQTEIGQLARSYIKKGLLVPDEVTLGGEGTCPKCGSEMQQRMDDREDTVKSRLTVYTEQTAPLIEFYKAQGKLFEVDGMGTPDEVFAEVRKVLG